MRSLALCAVVLLAASAPGLAAAQSIQVRLSADSITTEDQLQVSFVINGQIDGLALPAFERDWKVLRQGESSQFSIQIGGRTNMVQGLTKTFVLAPKHAGTLAIGAATLSVGGRVVARSEPVQVHVRKVETVPPSVAQKQVRSRSDPVFIAPEAARDVVYLGESFLVSWVLHVRDDLDFNISDLGELVVPETVQRQDLIAGNFKAEDQPEVIGGQKYIRAPVVREIWKFLKPGVLEVSGLTVQAVVSRKGRWGGQRVRLQAPPLRLEVRNVPSEGRPRGFREGAIGQFQVSASIQPDAEQERAVLELVISGSGSLQTLEAPPMGGVTGARVRVLPSEDRDKIDVGPGGVTGRRVFQYLLIPERSGTVFVPGVTLDYFDPAAGAFRQATSQPLTYTARQASASTRRSAVGVTGQEAAATLHSILGQSSLASISRAPVHRRVWYLALLVAPLLAFVGVETSFAVRRRRREGSGKARARRALGAARRALRAVGAPEGAGGAGAVYGEIARVIGSYLQDRFAVSATGLTHAGLHDALAGHGVPRELATRVVEALESCDFARFAGGTGASADVRETARRAEALLTDLEKHGG